MLQEEPCKMLESRFTYEEVELAYKSLNKLSPRCIDVTI